MAPLKLLTKLLLTCKQATEYIERHKDGELPPKQRAQLRLHLLICHACRAYNSQSQQIHSMLEKHLKHSSNIQKKEDNQELKARILSNILKK